MINLNMHSNFFSLSFYHLSCFRLIYLNISGHTGYIRHHVHIHLQLLLCTHHFILLSSLYYIQSLPSQLAPCVQLQRIFIHTHTHTHTLFYQPSFVIKVLSNCLLADFAIHTFCTICLYRYLFSFSIYCDFVEQHRLCLSVCLSVFDTSSFDATKKGY